MDKIYIANLALTQIGAQRISSFNEGSKSANAISAVYEAARDEVLEEHPWTFAQKRVALATLATVLPMTEDGVSTVYAIPDDFLKLTATSDPNATVYVESAGIVSDTLTLKIRYTFRNDNPATYPAKFIQALTLNIAHKLCFNIAESVQKAELVYKEYAQALDSAISSDSQNGTPLQPRMDEWLSSRMAGSGGYPPQKPGAYAWWPWV